MSKTLLVIGQTGQLAQALAKTPPKALTPVFAGRGRFDLGTDDPIALLRSIKPIAVINAAAYNAVDAAETNEGLALRVNCVGPGTLAKACADLRLPLVHVSTDYVFDGLKHAPYVETDVAHPLGMYGRSKLEGENAVLASGGSVAVVRTSWVFGSSSANFLSHMLNMLDGPEEAKIVADQVARPTWAKDLAAGVGRMAELMLDGETRAHGLFHLTGADDAGRVEMAEMIFDWAKGRGHRTPKIRKVSTADFAAAAKRPLDTRLDCTKLRKLGIIAQPWREQLIRCLEERAS